MAKKAKVESIVPEEKLTRGQTWLIVIAILLVIVQATAMIFAVDIEPRNGRGTGALLLALYFNAETPTSHIVSEPLLWLARATVVAIVACLAGPVVQDLFRRRRAARSAVAQTP